MAYGYRSILLVEDDPAVLDNLSFFLQQLSYTLYSARDGLAAYELYKEKAPDIIITDIELPGMDGLKFIEKMRQNDPLTPVIVISAYSDNTKLLKALGLHLVDYIVKPINSQKLKSAVQKAFYLRRSQVQEQNPLVDIADGFRFDMKTKQLTQFGKVVHITPKQAELIYYLIMNKNEAVDAIDIFNFLYNDPETEYVNSRIRNHIARIRKILPEHLIENVYSGGYRLNLYDESLF